MGQSQSNPGVYKYSDAEIRTNIDNMFKFNKKNNADLSEATYTMGDLNNYPTEDNYKNEMSNDLQMGGKIRFKPSQRRYLNHNIEDFVVNTSIKNY